MIDYILRFTDDAQRERFLPTPEGSPPSWYNERGDSIMPITIFKTEEIYDEEGALVAPATHPNGSWVIVRTKRRIKRLRDSPLTMIAFDSDKCRNGLPFVFIKNVNLTWNMLKWRISPVWCGDAYDFKSITSSHFDNSPDNTVDDEV